MKPLEKDCELFDTTYVQCNDPAVDQRTATAVSQFEAWALGHPGKRGQVGETPLSCVTSQPATEAVWAV